MSDCSKCIFRDVYRDMGATADFCTLLTDLTLAIAEIRFYSLCKTCKYYLSKDDLRSFTLNNDKEDVADVFNYIKLNKELKK